MFDCKSWIRSGFQIICTRCGLSPSRPTPPPTQHRAVMKSIHVSQLGSVFVLNRRFAEMIDDRCSSSYANLWDSTRKPLISATGKALFIFFFFLIHRACLDFIPWCKLCFCCNHEKAQLASVSPRLNPPAHHPEPPTRWSLSPLPLCLSLVPSKAQSLLFFSTSCTYFLLRPLLVLFTCQPEPLHPVVTLTHFLQQLPPHWMASAPPVVRLDWIQLGRLFTLPSLLLGPMRLLMPPPLPVPQSNTHPHTQTHSASICLNNFPPGGAF